MTEEIIEGYATTNIKWKIENLYTSFLSQPNEKFSEGFTIERNQNIEFALYFDACSPFTKPGYKPLGVVLRKFDQAGVIKVNAKLWIESEKGTKMTDHLFPEFEFSASNQKCGFSLELGKEFSFFNNCFTKNESVMLCVSFEYAVLANNSLLDLSSPSEPSLVVKVQNRTFKVSKKAMAEASPIFNELLSKTKGDTIELNELPGELAEALFVWIHCRKISDVASVVENLFVVADKYEMIKLKLECLEAMAHSVNAENLFMLIVLGFMYEKEVPQLKQGVLEFAVQKPRSRKLTPLFNSQEWAELVLQNQEMADKIMDTIFNKTEEV